MASTVRLMDAVMLLKSAQSANHRLYVVVSSLSMICFTMEGGWIFTNCWRQANASDFVVCAVGLFELLLHVECLADSWLALGTL